MRMKEPKWVDYINQPFPDRVTNYVRDLIEWSKTKDNG
jgi:hypothetical protein